MIKLVILICAFNLSSVFARRFPITTAESKLFNYFEKLSKITFTDGGVHLEPWIECQNIENKETYFSAGLYQFGSVDTPSLSIKRLVLKSIKYARNKQVRNAKCYYDINYFNICGSRGFFALHYSEGQVAMFNEGYSTRWCF